MNIDAVPIADRKSKEIRVKEWLRHCPQKLVRKMRDEDMDEPESEYSINSCVFLLFNRSTEQV